MLNVDIGHKQILLYFTFNFHLHEELPFSSCTTISETRCVSSIFDLLINGRLKSSICHVQAY